MSREQTARGGKALTKQTLARVLGLPDAASLTRHSAGSYTFTARFKPGEEQGREPGIRAALVEGAQGGGYMLRVRRVSRVLGVRGGYAQRFVFDVVRNPDDPAENDIVLVCAAGRGAVTAVLSGPSPRNMAGLVEESKAGARAISSVFDALANVPLPARVTVVADQATARELAAAREGKGGEATRRLLAAEPRLTVEPVAREDVEPFGAYGSAGLRGAALLRVHRVCREVAAAITGRGLLTATDLDNLEGAHRLFYAAGAAS